MTMTSDNATTDRDPADIVLYLGAAIVFGVGASWLLLSQPWQGAEDNDFASEPDVAVAPEAEPTESRLSTPEPTIGEMLRMADVALTAGMLVEPERYSAWKLYSDALRADPENADAREGMLRVADLLIERGTTALEQGRTAGAREVLSLVQRRFPDHVAATELGEQLAAAEEAQRARVANELTPPTVETSSESLAGAAPDLTDPFEELRTQFDAALAAGNLLQPTGDSAKDILNEMAERDADHAFTSEAGVALINTILGRAFEAIEVLDASAARAWIDAARELGADPARADGADAALTMAMVTAESQRLRPATELTLESYTAPRYPLAAERRQTAGWVDVEFVVTVSGQTRDVTVTDASHETLFRQEAVAAVETWRFQPKIFLDRPIEQRTYTRIRFAVE